MAANANATSAWTSARARRSTSRGRISWTVRTNAPATAMSATIRARDAPHSPLAATMPATMSRNAQLATRKTRS
jgi:hypothetical protein